MPITTTYYSSGETASTYTQRVWKTLAEFSAAPTTINGMVPEWAYFGQYRDKGQVDGACGLCQHPRIRYEFFVHKIDDALTVLSVGSDCIKKWTDKRIAVCGPDGAIFTDTADIKRRLDDDVAFLTHTTQRGHVRRYLYDLSKKDAFFSGFWRSYSLKTKSTTANKFTPNQLVCVLKGLTQHHIAHDKTHFKCAFLTYQLKLMKRTRPNDFALIKEFFTKNQLAKLNRLRLY